MVYKMLWRNMQPIKQMTAYLMGVKAVFKVGKFDRLF